MPHDQWEFWIDRGGTFTDVVARDPEGAIHIHKLLSENPEHYDDAPLEGIRRMLGVERGAAIPPERIRAVKMGTTLATNALLERKGAKVGLVVTKGFRDLLEIGYQNRPELFALAIRKPEQLAAAIFEADERVLADGTVRTQLDETGLREGLAAFREQGIDAVGVLFLHSFAYPAHEAQAGEIAEAMGFRQVSLSHRVAQEIKAVGRGDTTMADAYLTPIMQDYVARVRAAWGADVNLRFMQSNGGLIDADRFSGKDAILSGPAGGVAGYANVCRLAGLDKAVGFDMGGTSTDVSRYDREFERIYEKMVSGVRIKAPMLHIETVAAGGGSILRFDQGRFRVGPDSAGADPGPACYRRGGPACVTDANAVLGRVQAQYFPEVFGPEANEALDVEASRAKLDAIRDEIETATGEAWSLEDVATGFVRIANENMVKPIKAISVSRGYDVQEYALACFGGAGAQHACAIAEELGMETVLLHPYAGVLSAYGMGFADTVHANVEAVLERLGDGLLDRLEECFRRLEKEGRELMREEGFDSDDIATKRTLDLRYEGVDAFLNLAAGDDLLERFTEAHHQLYGFTKESQPVEVVNIRVETVGTTEKPGEAEAEFEERPVDDGKVIDTVTVHFDEKGEVKGHDTPVYRRRELAPGERIEGPALIVEEVSTVVVDPGWHTIVNGRGHLLVTKQVGKEGERVRAERDPVMLEVFNNLFMSVAEQMGKTLERVSHSVNIKERLDFSCAVFSSDGDLVANAPHMPVHLGAMSETIKAVLAEREDSMKAGEVYVTNDPYHGGSHLPDVTVITPVFNDKDERIFFVASRGHHADIGGKTPGSMPAFSESLQEEGVVIRNALLVADGKLCEEAIVETLTSAEYPVRDVDERLSDLRAQIAANNTGMGLLRGLCVRYGEEVVHAYMGHVRTNAAEAMREALAELPDGEHHFEDTLDDGETIACTIAIDGEEAVVDFAGTDDELKYNLNAPPAVVKAAVLYVFRTLIGKEIPLNAGCLDPIAIKIPEGCLLNPTFPAPVAGGNVETSMRVVDVLYGALKTVAASQGTMNNLTFGTEEWAYYETICGGSGAGPEFDGASAVHTHMTNTRITDPEVLERRHPVVLREFLVRRGSGGKGDHSGGDGVRRVIEFLEAMDVSILSERRATQPYGVNGGKPGASGRNYVVKNGEERKLEGRDSVSVEKGDIFVVETPGGGGYNAAENMIYRRRRLSQIQKDDLH